MAAPRKHHFIPAFYLKQWASADGVLIEWSKPYKKVVPIRRHPNATAFQTDLYTFPGLLPDSRPWFEDKFLRSTDELSSQALTRLLAGQLLVLDDLRKSGWVRFLMTLRFRHPDLVAEMRQRIEVLWKNHDPFTRAEYERIRSADDPKTCDGFIDQLGPDADTRVQLDLLVAGMDNEQIGRHIVSMVWAVVDLSNAVHRLLTSDWPVELSLGATPPTVAIPISPTLLFAASDDMGAIRKIVRADSDEVVAMINKYVVGCARRYVFSSDERQKVFIENRMSTVMAKPPFFPNIVPPRRADP